MIFILESTIIIFSIFACLYEYKLYKTIFTPYILFSVPYIIVIFIQQLWIYINKAESIHYEFLSYVLIFFVVMSLLGNITILILNKIFFKQNFFIYKRNYKNSRYAFFEILSIFSSIYLLIYFVLHMYKLDTFAEIVQEKFQNQYSGGINFYFRIIAMIGAVYFFSIAKNLKFLLLGILCLLPNFLTFVKGISIIIILAGLIANLMIYQKTIKFKTIILFIIVVVLIFSLVYLIEISIWNPDKLFNMKTYLIIWNKIITYIISGVQSFNVNSVNIDDELIANNPIFAPLINFLHKFGVYDYRIDTIGSIRTIIAYNDFLGIVEPNINTYIGTILIYSGIKIGTLVHIFISVIIYIIFFISIKTKNIFDIIMYALLVSGFVLGWFEYYYMHTFWIYLIIYIVLIRIGYFLIKSKKR